MKNWFLVFLAATTVFAQAPRPPVDKLSLMQDATITNPIGGQALMWNAGSGKWVNRALVEGDVTNLTTDLAAKVVKSANLSDLTSVSTARTNLGLAIGTDVQAFDSDLASIAALSTTSAGRSLLTLSAVPTGALVGISDSQTLTNKTLSGSSNTFSNIAESSVTSLTSDLAGKQGLDSELTALAGLTSAADKLPYFTGSGTASLATFTTFGRSLVDDADAATSRTTLGLGTSATVNIGTSGALVPLLSTANTWTTTQTMPVIDVGGAVYNVSGYAGATLGAKIQAAHDAMPSSGGTLDCRGVTGAQTISSTITLTKACKILFGNQTITASAGFAINSARTVVMEGLSTSTTITINGCDLISWSGNYSQNKNNLRIQSLNLVGGTGTPHIVYDATTYPSSLNFSESMFRFEGCRVSGFTVDYPIRLGASFYYSFVHWNNFNSNTYSVYTDRFSDLSFSHNSGISMGQLKTNGCNARITDNSWAAGGQVTADIWVDAGSNGADGMVFMSNNKHGTESEYYRVVTDAVTNGTTTITSATAAFTSADVGGAVTGTNIPASTTITSVTNSTTAVLSAAATGSGTGGTIEFLRYKIVIKSTVNAGYSIPDVEMVNCKLYASVSSFGQKAIDIESPVRALKIIGSTFDGFAYCLNDIQPTPSLKSDSSVWMGNTVTNMSTRSLAGSVSRVFVNNGRGFNYCDDDIHANAMPPKQTLRDVPYLSNRVPYSDTFSSWTANGVTVTGSQSDPLGGTTASLLTRAGSITSENIHTAITIGAVGSAAALATGSAVTKSIWLKAGNVSSAELGLYDATDAGFVFQAVVPLSTAWKRFSIPIGGLVSGHNYSAYVYPGSSSTPAAASTVSVWHSQVSDYDSDFLATSGSAATTAVGTWLTKGLVAAGGIYDNEASPILAGSFNLRRLYDDNPTVSIDWENRELADDGGIVTVDWLSRILNNSWTANSDLTVGGSLDVTGPLYIADQTAPSTPASGSFIYFDASNRFSWKGTNGFVRTFDGTANTADRIYVLPNAAGTVVLDSATQTLTNKTLTSPTLTTPALGTPSAVNLSNATNVPAYTFATAPVGVPFTVITTGVSLTTASGTNTAFFTVPTSRTFVCTGGYAVITAVTSYNSTNPVTLVAYDITTSTSLSNTNTANSSFSTLGKMVNFVPSSSGGQGVAAAGDSVGVRITNTQNTSITLTATIVLTGFYIS